MFANMEQAYEDLEDGIKAGLQGLTSVNRNFHDRFEQVARRTGAAEDRVYADWLQRDFPETRFPVFRSQKLTRIVSSHLSHGESWGRLDIFMSYTLFPW